MGKEDSKRWRVEPGHDVDLSGIDPRGSAGVADRKHAEADIEELHDRLSGLQERLWAEQRQSLLVVLQAMDTGGKDGTIKHVFRGLNPSGCRVAAFKVPSEVESRHDFLWRAHREAPAAGEVTVFNRSHYEDVLVVRVHELVPAAVWRPRYELINHFEGILGAGGTRVVKLFLHISEEEQAERLRDRLADPAKHWKFRRADLGERARWDDYMKAYEEALTRTSTAAAPWFVVPADRKWYRNWAVSRILVEALDDMAPQYPPGEDLSGVVVT